MTMVTVTYILFAPEGFALPYWLSLAGASLVAFVFLSLFARVQSSPPPKIREITA